MTFKTRTICLALASAVLFPTSIFAAGGASTPEKAFASLQAAMKNKDYKAGFVLMTPESQEMRLAGLALGMSRGVGVGPEKAAEAQKLIEKYGIKKLDPASIPPGQDPRPQIRESVADVKDKPACFAELMMWMETNSPSPDRDAKIEMMNNAKLTNLKADGDAATGTVNMKDGANESSNPIRFKKIDGLWYIDLATPPGPPGRAASPGK